MSENKMIAKLQKKRRLGYITQASFIETSSLLYNTYCQAVMHHRDAENTFSWADTILKQWTLHYIQVERVKQTDVVRNSESYILYKRVILRRWGGLSTLSCSHLSHF